MVIPKSETHIFVWVKGLAGPAPEVWKAYDNKDSHNREIKEVLQKHELPKEYKDLSLMQLEMIYPYKGAE